MKKDHSVCFLISDINLSEYLLVAPRQLSLGYRNSEVITEIKKERYIENIYGFKKRKPQGKCMLIH
jgi:hypothetical protein